MISDVISIYVSTVFRRRHALPQSHRRAPFSSSLSLFAGAPTSDDVPILEPSFLLISLTFCLEPRLWYRSCSSRALPISSGHSLSSVVPSSQKSCDMDAQTHAGGTSHTSSHVWLLPVTDRWKGMHAASMGSVAASRTSASELLNCLGRSSTAVLRLRVCLSQSLQWYFPHDEMV